MTRAYIHAAILFGAACGSDGGATELDSGAKPQPGPGVIDTRPDVAAFERGELRLAQQPDGLVAADFDGDGLRDLAVRDIGGGVSLFLQRASAGAFPRFELSQAWPSSEPRQRLPIPAFRSFDVDRDGRVDLVTGGQLLHNLPGGFQAVALPSITGCASSTTSFSDFDRDGQLDMLVTCLGSDPPRLFSALSFVNPQTSAKVLAGGWGVSRLLRVADANGDGVDDFVIGTGSGVRAYQLTSSSLDPFADFPACVAPAGGGFPSDLAVFDADGKDGVDFAAACDPAEIVLGTPGAANLVLPYPATLVVSADLAGEGKRELVSADDALLHFGAVVDGAYEKRGEARVPQDIQLTTTATVLLAADLNADRRDEIVVAKTLQRTAGNASLPFEHQLTVLWPR